MTYVQAPSLAGVAKGHCGCLVTSLKLPGHQNDFCKTVLMERRMKPLSVRSPEQHLFLCYEFVQLSTFGIMRSDDAIYHLNQDWLKLKEVSLFPLAGTLTLIELTQKGRVECNRFIKFWENGYLQALETEDPGWVLQDEYVLSKDINQVFALTQERFDREKREGRLSEVIRRCPAIETMDPI